MSFRKLFLGLSTVFILTACTAEPTQTVFPTYDPFLPATGLPSQPDLSGIDYAYASPSPGPTPTRQPTPTKAPFSLPAFFGANNPTPKTPTPDPARILPTPRLDAEEYVVQPGDSLGGIAQRYGISLQALLDANSITDPNLLEVGTVLLIPAPAPTGSGSALKIIPDSELVYSPSAVDFNVEDFVASQNGYLAVYYEDVNGTILSGVDILKKVATNYSVNPRILLALLEYQSGWVTNPEPANTAYPLGYYDENRYGLYRQLAWAANTLNRGYYLWRANALSTLVLADGQVIPVDPTINAGTSAIQYFFSELDDYALWQTDTSETGVVLTYFVFFGNPFNYAIEPLVPAILIQPQMALPFAQGETWHFTGGPHGGWDSGSAWAALDFAPADNPGGCSPSAQWVTAIASGFIVRAEDGAVMQDLDGDGYEQTGWAVLYMHIGSEERIQAGEYLFVNERVGHPSCEGGVSNATHVHLARKYNGEWIPADGGIPFNLGGWLSRGGGIEYDGFLANGTRSIEAIDGASEENLITR
jgi:LysM repeat protein